LLAVDEVERGQQHLTADEAVTGEHVVVGAHETALTHCRHRLEGGEIGGAGVAEAEGGKAGGDGARRDDHDAVALAPKRSHLAAQLVDHLQRHLAVRVGERRRADLDDDDHSYSKVMPPMCTVSPGRAPALASARSTPSRRRRPWT